jgi:thymidylate kinase
MSPTSLQLLHVAAHVDAIETVIRPRLTRGDLVLLDRYWWSTWVYGLVGGADIAILHSIIDVERKVWAGIQPIVVFLIRRSSALAGGIESEFLKRVSDEYDSLAAAEGSAVSVVTIDNETSVEASAFTVVSRLQEMLSRELS